MKASTILKIIIPVAVTISVLLFFSTYYYKYKYCYAPLKDDCCIINNSFNLFKALFTYVFPTPNIHFREGSSSTFKNEEESGVKEAVAKTFEKGKAALEESARSAASLAKDTFSNNQDDL